MYIHIYIYIYIYIYIERERYTHYIMCYIHRLPYLLAMEGQDLWQEKQATSCDILSSNGLFRYVYVVSNCELHFQFMKYIKFMPVPLLQRVLQTSDCRTHLLLRAKCSTHCLGHGHGYE